MSIWDGDCPVITKIPSHFFLDAWQAYISQPPLQVGVAT